MRRTALGLAVRHTGMSVSGATPPIVAADQKYTSSFRLSVDPCHPRAGLTRICSDLSPHRRAVCHGGGTSAVQLRPRRMSYNRVGTTRRERMERRETVKGLRGGGGWGVENSEEGENVLAVFDTPFDTTRVSHPPARERQVHGLGRCGPDRKGEAPPPHPPSG